MRHPFFDLPTPIVVGHRGASGEQPENTLPSFERAIAQGAQVLETDVHLSRDGVVVVFHDADLERTTGTPGPLAERSFAELRQLDAGHGFSPDAGRSFPARGQGIQIPSLEEVFDAFPGIRFNIEVKRDDPRLMDATLSAVANAGREKLTLLAAELDSTMASLRRHLADRGLAVAQGACRGDVIGFVQAAREGRPPPPEPMALQVPTHFGDHPLVTRELVDFAHAHDTQIHVWTVNETAEMERLLELGVDAVMSDFPGRFRDVVARNVRGERGQESDA